MERSVNKLSREEIVESLKSIGLSKNEVEVYLALINFGQMTAWKIAEITKLHRANIYEALKNLEKKGLVLCSIKERVKYFEASDPKLLLNYLKEKEIILQKVVSQITSMKVAKTEEKVYIAEGMSGIKAVTEDILLSLKRGDCFYCYGLPKDTAGRMRDFIDLFHERRIKKGIYQKHIYNENAKERIAFLNSLPITEARYLPSKFNSPVSTTIYGNKVSFWLWSENPLVITIESKRMAEAYKRYFSLLWKEARKN